MQAIRAGGGGDVTDSIVAWKYGRAIPFVPSCLFLTDRLYMAKSGGVVTCLDARTGERIYQKRLGRGNYFASPVAANNRIYLASREGTVTVFRAGDDPEVLAQNDLKGSINSCPAIAGDSLYIRTETCLYAFIDASTDPSP